MRRAIRALRVRLAAVLVALAWLLPHAGAAQSVPDWTSVHLNDFAGVIDAQSAGRIVAALQAARTDPGAEITVLTVPRRADYGDHASIEAFARAVFNAWGVGDATLNNGILILVAVEDREIRIQLGDGYPPVYDGRALRVIDVLMLPEFRAGRIAAGIEAGVAGAVDHLARPWAAGTAVTGTSGIPDPGGAGGSGLFWLIVGGFATVWGAVALGFVLMLRRRRRCPQCGRHRVTTEVAVLRAPAETIEGESRQTRRCPDCGWTGVDILTVASLSQQRREAAARRANRSSSGGGGGGSFGGGSSSGGGASGRW